MEYSEIEFI